MRYIQQLAKNTLRLFLIVLVTGLTSAPALQAQVTDSTYLGLMGSSKLVDTKFKEALNIQRDFWYDASLSLWVVVSKLDSTKDFPLDEDREEAIRNLIVAHRASAQSCSLRVLDDPKLTDDFKTGWFSVSGSLKGVACFLSETRGDFDMKMHPIVLKTFGSAAKSVIPPLDAQGNFQRLDYLLAHDAVLAHLPCDFRLNINCYLKSPDGKHEMWVTYDKGDNPLESYLVVQVYERDEDRSKLISAIGFDRGIEIQFAGRGQKVTSNKAGEPIRVSRGLVVSVQEVRGRPRMLTELTIDVMRREDDESAASILRVTSEFATPDSPNVKIVFETILPSRRK